MQQEKLMETTHCRSEWEQKPLINELVQGIELARRLKAELSKSCYSRETANFLVQKMLYSFEKSLLLLKGSGSGEQVERSGTGASVGLVPESPVSVNGSPQTEDLDMSHKDYYHQEHRDGSKKRKTLPRWIEQVRVSSETGLEGPHDDGYSWRKYGQKDILGAKYPRSYYRCTFRNTKNCWATKQVQRSDEDPTLFEVTYRGRHGCLYGNNAVPAPASPDKKQRKEYNHSIIDTHHHGQSSPQMITSLHESLSSFNTENLETEEMAIYPFTFPSTSFGCMTSEMPSSLPFTTEHNTLYTPDSNYFTVLPSHVTNFGPINSLHLQCSGSDLTEIISANTSATNSPIPDLDFILDPVQIDVNFPFDSPELFS